LTNLGLRINRPRRVELVLVDRNRSQGGHDDGLASSQESSEPISACATGENNMATYFLPFTHTLATSSYLIPADIAR
jgi:hypothetical protein